MHIAKEFVGQDLLFLISPRGKFYLQILTYIYLSNGRGEVSKDTFDRYLIVPSRVCISGSSARALTDFLVFGINKLLACMAVLAGSSPQKAGFLVHNWSVSLAEARADRDRARVYFPQTLSMVASGTLIICPQIFSPSTLYHLALP